MRQHIAWFFIKVDFQVIAFSGYNGGLSSGQPPPSLDCLLDFSQAGEIVSWINLKITPITITVNTTIITLTLNNTLMS